jgi:hypothetical protein
MVRAISQTDEKFFLFAFLRLQSGWGTEHKKNPAAPGRCRIFLVEENIMRLKLPPLKYQCLHLMIWKSGNSLLHF